MHHRIIYHGYPPNVIPLMAALGYQIPLMTNYQLSEWPLLPSNKEGSTLRTYAFPSSRKTSTQNWTHDICLVQSNVQKCVKIPQQNLL